MHIAHMGISHTLPGRESAVLGEERRIGRVNGTSCLPDLDSSNRWTRRYACSWRSAQATLQRSILVASNSHRFWCCACRPRFHFQISV